MRHRAWWILAAGAAFVAAAGGAEPKTVRVGTDEVLWLDGLADPNRWGPAECTVSAERKLTAEGRPTLHMHIPVDHHGGEKAYPIGWPRMYLNLKPGEKEWGAYERFEFDIHARMTREKPPKKVLSLQVHCPAKPHVYRRNLEEIRLGKWVRVAIPVREIRRVAEVARLGLNISESDYRHGETLDFRVGGFRLVRAAEFGVAGIEARTRIVYQDRPALVLRVEAVGPPSEKAADVPLAVRRDDKTVHTRTVKLLRGVHRLRLDLSDAKLAPGRYRVVAFPEAAARRKAAAFRVVESPWQEGAG